MMLASAVTAHAQSSDVTLKMDSGFYVGAGVAHVEAREFCQIGGSCDKNDVGWNVFAGYRFNRHLAVEGGYTDLGETSSSGFSGGVPTRFTSQTTGFELTGLGIVPLTERFGLYAKLGFFRYDNEVVASGGFVGSVSEKGTELTFGFGAEYAFGQAAARLEWQRYYEITNARSGLAAGDTRVLRLAARYKF